VQTRHRTEEKMSVFLFLSAPDAYTNIFCEPKQELGRIFSISVLRKWQKNNQQLQNETL